MNKLGRGYQRNKLLHVWVDIPIRMSGERTVGRGQQVNNLFP